MNNFKTITLSLSTIAAIALTGCGGGGDSAATTPPAANVPTLSGNIISDTTVSVDTRLSGIVKVKSGAVLTINPGVTIYGDTASVLMVTKGSKLMADGNATHPITFTSIDEYTTPGNGLAGQWGGIALLGQAGTNEAATIKWEVYPADADAAFGGTIENDNSGILRYVEVEYCSTQTAANKETNGISLAGVGSGTIIDHVTITESADDGLEAWGGSVNISNLTVVNAQDDSLDLDSGYNGLVTNLTITQGPISAGLIEVSTGGDAAIRKTELNLNGAILTAAGSAATKTADEGGFHIKSPELLVDINNTIFNMSANTAVNGAFFAAKVLATAPTLTNNIVNDTNAGRGTATGPGASVIDTAFSTAGTNNTRN